MQINSNDTITISKEEYLFLTGKIELDKTVLEIKNKQLAEKEAKINELEAEIKIKEEKIKQYLHDLYAKKSERMRKLIPEDFHQLLLFKPIDEIVKETEPVHEILTPRKSRQRGRRKIPAILPEFIDIISVDKELQVDENGEQLVIIGYEVTEKLDYIPGTFYKRIIKREVYGYKDSRDRVFVAEQDPFIVPKGKLTDRLIEQIVFDKYFNSMPLYRQLKNYNAMGADLSKSTVSDAVSAFAKFYEPVAEAIKKQIFKSVYVHADESPLKFQIQNDDKKNIKQGYVYVYRDNKQAYFHYGGSREKSEIENVLNSGNCTNDENEGYMGYLMTDGYQGYSAHSGKRLACMAHVRRKYFVQANENKNAASVLTLINKLYSIEKDIFNKKTENNWTEELFYEKRKEAREEHSKEILDEIKKKLEMLQPICAPKSRMGEAISYTLKRWDSLCLYKENGCLPIDNNAAERSLRSMVVGRKNYLFAGSLEAGKNGAICYTIMESCHLQGIDPRDYLTYMTDVIHSNNDNPEFDYSLHTPVMVADIIKNMPKNF